MNRISVLALRYFHLWIALACMASGSSVYAQSGNASSVRSISELKKEATSGDVKAQISLGWLYEYGKGVPRDESKAVNWYRTAADNGSVKAQLLLGCLYEYGAPNENQAEAAKWFRRAAEQGNAYAQFSVGAEYQYGWGVPQNNAFAAVWYRKAAEQGEAQAQESLGYFYLKGLGVPQDYVEAYFWFDIAAAGEIVPAISDFDEMEPVTAKVIANRERNWQPALAKERDEAASHLTPADLSRVQERARKWFENHSAKTNPQ